MSTDRELLEMAAKAAGMTDRKWSGSGMALMYDPSRPETTGSIGPDWNPLTDDGDALRLAVKLRIDISLWLYQNSVEAKTYVGAGRGISLIGDNRRPTNSHREGHGTDPFAATRRAIVRAAAEIAKATKEQP